MQEEPIICDSDSSDRQTVKIKINVEFDVKILEAMILNEDIVRFPFFLVIIRKLSDGPELTIEEIGVPLDDIEINSMIFSKESVHKLVMRPYFREFSDTNLICSNPHYKMLSSIKFDSWYKCIAYVLWIKIRKGKSELCFSILEGLKAKGDQGIYNKLRELMNIILASQYDNHKKRHLPVIKDGRSPKAPFRQLKVN